MVGRGQHHRISSQRPHRAPRPQPKRRRRDKRFRLPQTKSRHQATFFRLSVDVGRGQHRSKRPVVRQPIGPRPAPNRPDVGREKSTTTSPSFDVGRGQHRRNSSPRSARRLAPSRPSRPATNRCSQSASDFRSMLPAANIEATGPSLDNRSNALRMPSDHLNLCCRKSTTPKSPRSSGRGQHRSNWSSRSASRQATSPAKPVTNRCSPPASNFRSMLAAANIEAMAARHPAPTRHLYDYAPAPCQDVYEKAYPSPIQPDRAFRLRKFALQEGTKR